MARQVLPVERTLRAGARGIAVAFLFFGSASARADPPPTKAQCIEANTRGQDLRREDKVSAARDSFRACVSSSCPPLVRNDCARRLDEIDAAQPTIVFVAKDRAGKDVSAVHVTVDGKPVLDRLDGAALPVDPGEHVFTFTALGQPTVKATFVLAVGEKNRREQVEVGDGALPATASAALAPEGQGPASHLTITSDPNATISVDGQIVGKGRFDGAEAAGTHEVSVVETGMQSHEATIDLRAGETRTLDVMLEAVHHAPVWPWIVGGVALAAGAAIGGYFLFRPQDQTGPVPRGSLGTILIPSAWGVPR
jgi:hypothetical protein